MKGSSSIFAGLFFLVLGAVHGADQSAYPPAGDESAKFRAEVIVDGLDRPCGLTKRPRSERDAPQEILFAESGAGRVVSFDPTSPGESHQVLSGLQIAEAAQLRVRVSAWALGFVTPTKLAVYGGMKNGPDRVGVYVLPAEREVLSPEQQDHEVSIAENDAVESLPVLCGMTFDDTHAYFTNGGVEAPGQVYRSGLAANRIELPQPLLNTATAQESRWPTAVCLSPSATTQFLVTAFAGELTDAQDSRVVFLIPVSGKIALDLAPGLADIVGLAYSPSGQLYAIDFAWEDGAAGGVYRLDDARFDSKPACRAAKIADVARPTSILFSDGGALYVTSWGKGEGDKQGTIVKITGEF